MACVINVDLNRAKALKALYDYCGSNCSMFYSYLTAVIKDVNSQGELEFTDEFKHSWKERKSVNINESDSVKVKDAIIKFYNEKYPSVEEGTRKTKDFDKVKVFGYTNISAREEGKRHFANKMIQAFNNNKNAGENEVKTNVKEYCAANNIIFIEMPWTYYNKSKVDYILNSVFIDGVESISSIIKIPSIKYER